MKAKAQDSISQEHVSYMNRKKIILDEEEDSEPLIYEAMALMIRANNLLKKELNDPTLPIEYFVKCKKIAEEAIHSARSYSLEAEIMLGRKLIEMKNKETNKNDRQSQLKLPCE